MAPTYAPDDDPDRGSTTFYLDVGRNHEDRLAVLSVRALRDVFGVAHPAFLTSEQLDTRERPTVVDAAEEEDTPLPAEPLAVTPADRKHLQLGRSR